MAKTEITRVRNFFEKLKKEIDAVSPAEPHKEEVETVSPVKKTHIEKIHVAAHRTVFGVIKVDNKEPPIRLRINQKPGSKKGLVLWRMQRLAVSGSEIKYVPVISTYSAKKGDTLPEKTQEYLNGVLAAYNPGLHNSVIEGNNSVIFEHKGGNRRLKFQVIPGTYLHGTVRVERHIGDIWKAKK